MLRTFLNDEAGFIVSAELVLISTLLVIGLIVGLTSVQQAIVSELNDVGNAIGSLNQSYMFTGVSIGQSGNRGRGGATASTSGSYFIDHTDTLGGQSEIVGDLPMSERNRY